MIDKTKIGAGLVGISLATCITCSLALASDEAELVIAEWKEDPGGAEALPHIGARVGIGTDKPATALHVVKSGWAGDAKLIKGTGLLKVRDFDADSSHALLFDGNEIMALWDTPDRVTPSLLKLNPRGEAIHVHVNNEDRYRFAVHSSGNVSIGTAKEFGGIAGGFLDYYHGTPSRVSEIDRAQTGDWAQEFKLLNVNGDVFSERARAGYLSSRGITIGPMDDLWDESPSPARWRGDWSRGTYGKYQHQAQIFIDGAAVAQAVAIHFESWSDDVFDNDYHLESLYEVESTIAEEQSLAGVPSATEVLEEGVTVGATIPVLLRKVEELTLHTIEQEKRIQENAVRLKAVKNTLASVDVTGGRK